MIMVGLFKLLHMHPFPGHYGGESLTVAIDSAIIIDNSMMRTGK